MKNYVKPMMESEVFDANEYITACYHGVCNIDGHVFNDTNGNGQYDPGVDRYNYYNTACDHDYWIEGVDAQLPDRNAFVFQKIDFERVQTGSIFGIPIYDWVRVGVGEPVPAWNFDRDHTTTTLDLQNRPNHS